VWDQDRIFIEGALAPRHVVGLPGRIPEQLRGHVMEPQWLIHLLHTQSRSTGLMLRDFQSKSPSSTNGTPAFMAPW
jgi:hypothetical protein